MLLSSYTAWSLTYHLPTQLGVHTDYYFLELIPFALNGTLCVVFAAVVMDYFERRDRVSNGANREAEDDNEPNDQALPNERRNFFRKALQLLNTMILLLTMLACKFAAPAACPVFSFLSVLSRK